MKKKLVRIPAVFSQPQNVCLCVMRVFKTKMEDYVDILVNKAVLFANYVEKNVKF